MNQRLLAINTNTTIKIKLENFQRPKLHLKNFKTTKASSEHNVFTEILEYSDNTIHKFGTQNISLKNGLGLGP